MGESVFEVPASGQPYEGLYTDLTNRSVGSVGF